MIPVADVLEVDRSHLHARPSGSSRPCGSYWNSMDTELPPAIRRLVDRRPTYGYRQLTALLYRERPQCGAVAGLSQKRNAKGEAPMRN
jgi:hypothetical protein